MRSLLSAREKSGELICLRPASLVSRYEFEWCCRSEKAVVGESKVANCAKRVRKMQLLLLGLDEMRRGCQGGPQNAL